MDRDELVEQILETWRRHDQILKDLLEGVPRGGFKALPEGSRGRDVGRQFAHLTRLREGWVHIHRTGKRPDDLPRYNEGKPPTKATLRKLLKTSGKTVDEFLVEALDGKAKPRQFGRKVVRWLGYLISHESHHRGQIILALKQSGFELDEDLTLKSMWSQWITK